MKPRFSAFVLVLLSLLADVVGKAADCDAAELASKALVAISGADSHVRKQSYLRIANSEEWARTWANHLGTRKEDAYRPQMEVDFDRCLLITIFQGEQKNARGIRIDSVSETEDSVVIRFTELGYQTAGDANFDPPDRPYAFIIVPKTRKSIVLEENRPSMMPRPPEWREVARLNAEPGDSGS